MGINLGRIRGGRVAAALTLSAALTVGTLGVAPAIAAVDPNTASISGTLTQNTNGTVSPVTMSSVYVYSATTEEYLSGADTDSAGSYTVGGLAAGSYVVEFCPFGDGLAPEFFDNTLDFASATPVAVGAGVPVRGINALLEQGGTISGSLTQTSGGITVPAVGVNVYAVASSADRWGNGWAQTDASGRYTVDGLGAGDYKLLFEPQDPDFVSEWFTNAMGFQSATVVAVGTRAAVVGIDANLEVASSISGTVTKNVGGTVTTAENVSVEVFTVPGGDYVGYADTDAAGNYSVGSLMAGTYSVGFTDYYGSSPSLTPEFFDNVSEMIDAKPLTVGTGTAIPGINAELSDLPLAMTPVERLAGPDRFSTSAAISAVSFDPGVSVAYIANGYNFPDALSAAPVAGKDKAPVLLVSADGIPAPVVDELKRLKPGRIVVLGGVNAISNAVETTLKNLTAGNVTRTAGADRFATSAAISKAAFAPGVNVAYIANGYNFPDALSAAPVAGKNEAPVLLVTTDVIPEAIRTELQRLNPDRIVVLGGVNAVSNNVQTALDEFTAGAVIRLSGPDRFATSAAISEANFAANAPVVYIANAYNFPDALSGAPVAGLDGAPVLLVPTEGIPAAIHNELKRLQPARIIVLGGPQAVSTANANLLSSYIVK